MSRDARQPRSTSGSSPGRAQLTLVEHALCPLDPALALTEGLIHRGEFFYQDENRRQKRATAKVLCPLGLSPGDEYYLWGLIALTLAQPGATFDFYATPHYCLSELGLIRQAGTRGGRNYALFRQAIARLSAVTYLNDQFYDPVRGERRNVAFGFLSYSLPADPTSSRAWRFVWDPIFFEFCQAARGSLLFDFETYRSLDFASRRLFLLLKKIFWRQAQSPTFEVRHLGVNVLGFAPSVEVRDLKVKVARCAARLAALGIVALPEVGAGQGGWFEKRGVGNHVVRFRRGPYFDKAAAPVATDQVGRSPLYEPLKAIGFDDASAARILKKYKAEIVQVWADVTLAALEKAPGFFKASPQAYFTDSVEQASRSGRTPPDWWLEHRKEEERRERESQRAVLNLPAEPKPQSHEGRTFEAYLQGEGSAAFVEILERLTREFREGGSSAAEAARRAEETARAFLRNRFARQSATEIPAGPTALGDVLKHFKRP